jgi:DNA repair exonuclease SbcCD ATPase subunit
MTSDKREEIVRTHLEDLQSEMEAGSRQISTIADAITEMRGRLLARHLEQAEIAGTLVRRVAELRKSVRQQLETLADLRRAIREQKRKP